MNAYLGPLFRETDLFFDGERRGACIVQADTFTTVQQELPLALAILPRCRFATNDVAFHASLGMTLMPAQS